MMMSFICSCRNNKLAGGGGGGGGGGNMTHTSIRPHSPKRHHSPKGDLMFMSLSVV
jgi:hypothetical protein